MQRARMPQVGAWRRARRWGVVLASTLMLTGCQHMSQTEKGVVGGAGLGAATGAIIGSVTGNAGAGTAIGAAIGGIGGGLVGNGLENAERRGEARGAANAHATMAAAQPTNPLPIEGVASLARQGMTDTIIINQIRTTGSSYRLTHSDISYLKSNGVSDRVITEMQTTQARGGQVYAPAPGGPTGVQVGYEPR